MNLDMNNIVIYLLILFACAMGGFYMNSISSGLKDMSTNYDSQSSSITTLISEVKHLKENNGEIDMLKSSNRENWNRYGQLSEKFDKDKTALFDRFMSLHREYSERVIKIEAKLEK